MSAITQAAPQEASTATTKSKKRRYVHEGQLDLFAFNDDPVAIIDAVDALVTLHEESIAAIEMAQAATAHLRGTETPVDFTGYIQSQSSPEPALGAAPDADLEDFHADLGEVDEVDTGLSGRYDGESESFNAGDAGDEDVEKSSSKAGDTKGASSTDLYLSALRGKRFDPPTPDHEAELGRRSMQGDLAARTELIERNMRFAVSMARRYLKTGRPFDDLMQAAAEGLMAAAEKFNPEKGRFTTCASWWVRQRVQRSVQSDANMPTPAYLPYLEAKLKREAESATTEAERDKLLAKASKAAERLEHRRKSTVSLNQSTTGEEGGGELHELLASEAPGHEERVEQMQLVRKIMEFAAKLGDERSTNIFLLRSGMHPEHLGEARTLLEISEVYSMSRERVRQIYAEAAEDIATAMEYWAKGSENLPDGFRRGLLNPGRS